MVAATRLRDPHAADIEEVAGADVVVAGGAEVDAVAVATDEPGEGDGAGEEGDEQGDDVDSHS